MPPRVLELRTTTTTTSISFTTTTSTTTTTTTQSASSMTYGEIDKRKVFPLDNFILDLHTITYYPPL